MTSNEKAQVILVTGMSGAGKTSALKAFEDLNFEAIDHVPLSLLENLVGGGQNQLTAPGFARALAIGVVGVVITAAGGERQTGLVFVMAAAIFSLRPPPKLVRLES